MPKIIFRPNPSPPPFPPPSPSYPDNSISFSPMPFIEGQNVVATLHKFTLGDTIGERTLSLSNDITGSQNISNIPVVPGYNDNVSIQFVSEFDSDKIGTAIIEFYNGSEYETELELDIV